MIMSPPLPLAVLSVNPLFHLWNEEIYSFLIFTTQSTLKAMQTRKPVHPWSGICDTHKKTCDDFFGFLISAFRDLAKQMTTASRQASTSAQKTAQTGSLLIKNICVLPAYYWFSFLQQNVLVFSITATFLFQSLVPHARFPKQHREPGSFFFIKLSTPGLTHFWINWNRTASPNIFLSHCVRCTMFIENQVRNL